MAVRKHGRRAADTRVKTPLTELTESLSANYGTVGRRAAVVAAAGGLVVTATLPAMGDDTEDQASVAADTETDSTPEFVNQAKTVVPETDEDDDDLVGAASVENVTATAAPEPEPEPEPVQEASSESDDSSDSDSADSESSESGSDEGAESEDVSVPDGSKAEQVVAIAREYIGTPYVYGGTSPSGWDCSGFTSFVYNKVGVNLPRSSGAQASAGTQVSASEAQPGDLISHPGHVGIYVGDGKMIDAGSASSGTSERSHSWMGSVTFTRVL